VTLFHGYLLLIVPAWVLYARWFYAADRYAFGSTLGANPRAALGFGFVLAAMWPVGWFVLILALFVCGEDPFCGRGKSFDRWVKRYILGDRG